MNQIPEIFQYEHPVLPDNCKHIISPSLIYKFFAYPKLWYEEVMKGEKGFEGSTASITGTICHYIYEQVAKGENVVREEINRQLEEYLQVAQLPDVDMQKILKDYPDVVNCVVNAYILPHTTGYGKVEVEKQVYTEIDEGIYVAGTCDRIEGDCVVDYKTVSTKPNEQEIPFNYKIQLLAYVYVLRKLGYEINRIRIVYGVKPTKTLGARCVVVTENITFPDEQMINDTLRLINDSIKLSVERPDLNYIIFKSYALKEEWTIPVTGTYRVTQIGGGNTNAS